MGTIWPQPLESFRNDLSAVRPAPAGVAASAVAATLGIALLIKTLTISKQRPDLVEAALRASDQLKRVADEDIEAVREYMATKNDAALNRAIEVPMQAARSAVAALDLCAEAADHIKASVRADLTAAAHLLAGSVRAILVCVDANVGSRTQERDELESRAEVVLRKFSGAGSRPAQ